MAHGWFRFYDEVLDDPKVQKLPAETFKAWVNMMCLANRNGGKIPCLADVSFAFRITDIQAQGQLDLMLHHGFIDTVRGKCEIHNWKKRQYKSDSSTERVKKYRVEKVKRFSNVSETPDETHQNRTETEQNNPIVPSGHSVPFELFWESYPRKIGKGAAESSWKRQKLNVLLPVIMPALDAQKLSTGWHDESGKYIPNPATWLNQKRWNDSPTIVRPTERKLAL